MNVYARLGPILFILYINDIATQLDLDSTPLIFADDTTLLAFGDNTTETVERLNNDLKKISDWAKIWKLKFNSVWVAAQCTLSSLWLPPFFFTAPQNYF